MLRFFKKEKREPKNFSQILSQFKELKKDLERISREIEDLKRESKFSVQKIGLVRFNPFSEVGGNQSFSIALLDGNDNGLIITSLYTREGNRIYSKPIKAGVSEYSLAEEEKEAIEKARRQKNEKRNQGKFNKETPGGGGFRSH